MRSSYQQAEDYYNQSLALRRHIMTDGLDTAWSIIGLADVAFDRNDLVKAEQLYARALVIAEQFVPGSLIVSANTRHHHQGNCR